MNNIRNRGVLPALALAALALVTVGAHAQSDEILSLDIETQDAGSALVKLATSSGMEIVLDGETGKNKEVEGLKGEYRIEEALAALLADTGLTYEFASESRIVVREAQESSSEGGEDEEDADEEDANEEEAPLELQEQRITGSRMQGGDPTSTVISFTAEDMARRGISTVEELFRQMPWAYASNTSQSSRHFSAPVDVDREIATGDGMGIGVSFANLRALGSENSLILVNGRRVSGRGGSEYNAVNLLNIPLSSIERVDIDLGSASAIYGSDAIGGVINFITRKLYTGLELTVRQEYSATDADRRVMSVRGGYAWGSGSVTADLSRDESDPVNNRKIWTSMDYRDVLGPEYDRRSATTQPGIVCRQRGGFFSTYWLVLPRCAFGAPRLQLPPGHSGVGATVDNFTEELTLFDYVPPQNGWVSESLGLNVRAEQYLGENLMVYGEALFSEHDAYIQERTFADDYIIGADNAYNPFGYDLAVTYAPFREVESGQFPTANDESEHTMQTYNLGAVWRFGGSHELDVSVTRSESEHESTAWRARYHRTEAEPTAEEFYRILSSPDPNVAFNPFGDGSAQSADLSSFLVPTFDFGGRTVSTTIESVLRGSVLEIWGGPINYVVGFEDRTRKIGRNWSWFADRGRDVLDYWADAYAVPEPEAGLRAEFMELGFPLFGEKNARPGVQELYVSLQARRDTHTFNGPQGGIERIRGGFAPDAYQAWRPGVGWVNAWGPEYDTLVGTASILDIEKKDTTPRIGLLYKPVDSLSIRAAWTESFHPPLFSQQFSVEDIRMRDFNLLFQDYLHPDRGADEFVWVSLPLIDAPYDPEIRSEYADKLSLGIDWRPESIPGLRWTVDWSRTDFTDKIADSSNFTGTHPELIAGNEKVIQRDENGYPIGATRGLVNLAAKVSEYLETSVQYSFDTGFGRFTPRLTYSRFLDEYFQLTEVAEPTNRLGTQNGSDRYRLTGQLTWQWQRLAADLFVYYRPGYTNDRPGSCNNVVGRCLTSFQQLPEFDATSLTTVDLSASYWFDNGLRVRAGGRNLFERESPSPWAFSGILGYDPTRWDARGRVLYLELTWAM
ncbi:MAG: TonB-dependent receptor plug domain-containing protein [Gammaproteobacteria bacterium]|nr:TonB-dependent receptor plug domain-containing protein [Gammaproteobacteria bacterium]MYF59747.1 TonB-dependent receptor plug domain-containing protein [Gammaproteobacteria bacterium]